MTILITGATGFVGSAFCEALELARHNVRRSNQRLNEADLLQSLKGVDDCVLFTNKYSLQV